MIILKGTWKELRRIGSNVRLVRAYSDFLVYPHGKALVGALVSDFEHVAVRGPRGGAVC